MWGCAMRGSNMRGCAMRGCAMQRVRWRVLIVLAHEPRVCWAVRALQRHPEPKVVTMVLPAVLHLLRAGRQPGFRSICAAAGPSLEEHLYSKGTIPEDFYASGFAVKTLPGAHHHQPVAPEPKRCGGRGEGGGGGGWTCGPLPAPPLPSYQHPGDPGHRPRARRGCDKRPRAGRPARMRVPCGGAARPRGRAARRCAARAAARAARRSDAAFRRTGGAAAFERRNRCTGGGQGAIHVTGARPGALQPATHLPLPPHPPQHAFVDA